VDDFDQRRCRYHAHNHTDGIVDAMRTTIDRAGRLVIPKALRGQVGLDEGGEVEVDVQGAGIVIEPVTGHGFIEMNGRLVIPPTGRTIDTETVRRLRLADQR
jgi:AbrB family looped-hinge helix DNA binding protein